MGGIGGNQQRALSLSLSLPPGDKERERAEHSTRLTFKKYSSNTSHDTVFLSCAGMLAVLFDWVREQCADSSR